jgi:hypothetical protein
MQVTVDEPRQGKHARRIDDVRAGSFRAAGEIGPDADDPLTLDEDVCP